MLLHAAGKEVSEENLKKVLKAAGMNPDASRVKALTASLEGVDIEEAIRSATFAPAASAPAAEEKTEKKEEKKEEAEEVSEEDAAAGLGALFGF